MSKVLCPSSPAKEGSLLIGVVVGDSMAYVEPVAVTEEDLKEAGEHLEQRFRFSLPCLHDGCHNFTNGSCGLIKRFLERGENAPRATPEGESAEPHDRLPKCSIRSRCQWFKTAGIEACGVCPLVRTPVNIIRRGVQG